MNQIPSLEEAVLLPDHHPMLTTRMEEFDFEADGRDPLVIRDLLISAMQKYDGFGLAANQIGLECRAFAMMRFGRPTVMFNPTITELSTETITDNEGCLTFPDLWLKIARPKFCRIIYHDPDGNRQSDGLTGIESRAAQHEVDHLNGVVMTSKVSKLRLDMARKKKAKTHR